MTETTAAPAEKQRQPSRRLRIDRATDAANHRWRHKQLLIPGVVLPWSRRSRANSDLHHAAVEAGGAATKAQWKAHKRDFWNWYYGDIKEGVTGPMRTVIDTLERIEAACLQQYGAARGLGSERWEVFMHYVFSTYVAGMTWKMDPENIEAELWAKYQQVMGADAVEFTELLKPMLDYELEREQRMRQPKW